MALIRLQGFKPPAACGVYKGGIPVKELAAVSVRPDGVQRERSQLIELIPSIAPVADAAAAREPRGRAPPLPLVLISGDFNHPLLSPSVKCRHQGEKADGPGVC